MDHRRGERGSTLRAADVGHRVVVRRYVGDVRAGRPLYTDILGELVALDDQRLLVRTEDGTEHAIAAGEVAAGKRIGPRPTRYSEIVALERVGDEAWPAPVREPLGDWTLRSAEGWTNRANSALPLGDPGLAMDDAIEACVSWYRRRGLTPRITVPLPLRRDVADALTVAGWYAQPVVLVQTVRLGARPGAGLTVLLRAEPSEEFLAVVRARKTSLPDSAHQVLTGPAQVRFAEVRGDDGGLLAMARGALVRQWLHLGLVEVMPAARRLGHATRVSLALMEWARSAGAARAFLQVEEANAAAVALYRGMGFATHHRYITYALR
jgi:ribosomal protein S18 acetylase RimI-like enzyme